MEPGVAFCVSSDIVCLILVPYALCIYGKNRVRIEVTILNDQDLQVN